ncbi:MAG: energy transducer TonB [Thermodesulfovibrionales bacterium]
MDIRKNMALSLLLHTLLIIPVFSLAGRISHNPEVSSNCVMVSLLSEMRDMTSHIQEKVKIADPIDGEDYPAHRESDKHSDESNIKPADIAERKINSSIPPLNALPKAASEGAFLHNSELLGYGSPPSKQDDLGQIKDYYALITAAIEKAKTYPFLARKKKVEGTVIAAFRINAKGYPQDINIRKSSGFEILDSAAMNIVIKAAPFPHVVEPVEIPITFRITD